MYVCCAVKMEDVPAARVLKLAYDALGQWLGAHLLDLTIYCLPSVMHMHSQRFARVDEPGYQAPAIYLYSLILTLQTNFEGGGSQATTGSRHV
jgi:hypothetical protein